MLTHPILRGRFLARALVVALAPLAVSLPGTSQAALIDCPASFIQTGTAKVHDGTATVNTAASACQYLVPPDNSTVANEANVNAAQFFGPEDWTITSVNQLAPGNGSTGTWTIPLVDLNFSTYDYMIT